MVFRLNLEFKAEVANIACTIYHLALFILRIGDYQQIPNEIMINQDENKNRNHINTGVSFNFIHYMANLLG